MKRSFFTLIELLVVIAIIAILAGCCFRRFSGRAAPLTGVPVPAISSRSRSDTSVTVTSTTTSSQPESGGRVISYGRRHWLRISEKRHRENILLSRINGGKQQIHEGLRRIA